MSMVYLYDFLFFVGYLTMKHLFLNMHDSQFKLFMYLRYTTLWVEASYILGALYFVPMHSASERAVSFAMCMITKLVFGIVFEGMLNKNHKIKIHE